MNYTPITEETVWTEIANRLRTAASLTYIKAVFEGERTVPTDHASPYIVMEWLGTDEEYIELPKRKQSVMEIRLRGLIDVRTNLDGQVVTVGTGAQVGILRLTNDILKAFEGSDQRYSNNITSTDIQVMSSRIIDNALREVVIRLKVSFKYFDAGSRT
jgi:hypothetical protein